MLIVLIFLADKMCISKNLAVVACVEMWCEGREDSLYILSPRKKPLLFSPQINHNHKYYYRGNCVAIGYKKALSTLKVQPCCNVDEWGVKSAHCEDGHILWLQQSVLFSIATEKTMQAKMMYTFIIVFDWKSQTFLEVFESYM